MHAVGWPQDQEEQNDADEEEEESTGRTGECGCRVVSYMYTGTIFEGAVAIVHYIKSVHVHRAYIQV